MPRIGSRQWIAWKLVQLAHRIYDAEWYERLSIADRDGEELFEAVIVADGYGGGISSMTFPAVLPGDLTVHWDEDYKPDWLDEDKA